MNLYSFVIEKLIYEVGYGQIIVDLDYMHVIIVVMLEIS